SLAQHHPCPQEHSPLYYTLRLRASAVPKSLLIAYCLQRGRGKQRPYSVPPSAPCAPPAHLLESPQPYQLHNTKGNPKSKIQNPKLLSPSSPWVCSPWPAFTCQALTAATPTGPRTCTTARAPASTGARSGCRPTTRLSSGCCGSKSWVTATCSPPNQSSREARC